MLDNLDRSVAEMLERLGYEACREEDGLFSVVADNKAEGDIIADRICTELSRHWDGVHTSEQRSIECWPLDGVPWAEYGEEMPVYGDGTPVRYAVVVACPWGPLREPFEDQVDRILGDHAEFERVDRKWTLHYDDPSKADPAALVTTLKRSLGWWPCYGLEFRAERSGATVTLEIE